MELESGGVVGNSETAEWGGWGPSRGRKRNEDEQVKEETSKVQNVKWLAPETERGGLDSYATRLVCRVVCSAVHHLLNKRTHTLKYMYLSLFDCNRFHFASHLNIYSIYV